jgi:class 3 adenylate cyclase
LGASGALSQAFNGLGSNHQFPFGTAGVVTTSNPNPNNEQIIALNAKINQLESDRDKTAKAYTAKQKAYETLQEESREKLASFEEMKRLFNENVRQNDELVLQRNLSHLLTRVDESAQANLLNGGALRTEFERDKPCYAYVMSIDIRRSTELMLKARSPKLFAEFVTTLCSQLRTAILKALGVFDKFTGDGILAFFPDFYSGPDAGFRAVAAAELCHQVFAKHYKENRRCFDAVLSDTGLGIGIDYGEVQMVKIGGEFTVVGKPVVYACRMGAAKPGVTLLNEPAYNAIFDEFSALCTFDETVINFKNEGNMVAYPVKLNGKAIQGKAPAWLSPPPTAAAPPSSGSGTSPKPEGL